MQRHNRGKEKRSIRVIYLITKCQCVSVLRDVARWRKQYAKIWSLEPGFDSAPHGPDLPPALSMFKASNHSTPLYAASPRLCAPSDLCSFGLMLGRVLNVSPSCHHRKGYEWHDGWLRRSTWEPWNPLKSPKPYRYHFLLLTMHITFSLHASLKRRAFLGKITHL